VDFNEHVPTNPILGLVLAQSNLLQEAEEVDHRLKPTPSQYQIGPGVFAVIAGTDAKLDQDLTAVKVLDPEQHAETWPDWQERVQNSYLLCQWNSALDPVGGIGWFARVRLIELDEDKYREIRHWLEDWSNNAPSDMPTWMTERYNQYTDALAAASPGLIPQTAKCGVCGSANVAFVFKHYTEFISQAGELQTDGATYFVPLTDSRSECKSVAHLACHDCQSERHLETNEVQLNSGSDIVHFLNGHH
jgi:hypothetical protein